MMVTTFCAWLSSVLACLRLKPRCGRAGLRAGTPGVWTRRLVYIADTKIGGTMGWVTGVSILWRSVSQSGVWAGIGGPATGGRSVLSGGLSAGTVNVANVRRLRVRFGREHTVVRPTGACVANVFCLSWQGLRHPAPGRCRAAYSCGHAVWTIRVQVTGCRTWPPYVNSLCRAMVAAGSPPFGQGNGPAPSSADNGVTAPQQTASPEMGPTRHPPGAGREEWFMPFRRSGAAGHCI